MAQKKKKNRKQGHPGRQQRQQGVTAAQASLQRAMDGLMPDYLRWYEQHHGDDGLAMPCLLVMRNIFTVSAAVDGQGSITGFDPTQFAEVVETVLGVEEQEQELGDSLDGVKLVQQAVSTYVDFLSDTGRWNGPAQDLELLKELLGQLLGGARLAVGAGDTDPQALSSMEAAAVGNLNEMPVVRLGRDLLRWIGAGRAITPDGELAESEAREARELLGSQLSHQARSMEDLLLCLYLALALAEAIEIADNEVRPSAGAQDFLSEDPSVAFGSLFSFVHAFLQETVGGPDSEDPHTVEAWDLVVQTLLMATDGDPAPVGTPAPQGVSKATWQAVLAELDGLAELGLIAKDTHYDVPLAVGALLEGMFEEGQEELEDLDLDADSSTDAKAEAEPGGSNVIQLPTAVPPAAGQVLQLKLGLKYAKPPIWRRVLVPATMNLADLHQVIQVSFRWLDSHMHAFYPTRQSAVSLPMRDGELDERAVQVGQLLPAPKDKLGYIYDFGDNWELEITLEKLLDEDQGTVPRCTGGRRMAPVEDCGGVPGWEHLLEAIKDPGHEQYEELREWLGLEPEDELDDSAFDRERLNRALSHFA